MKQTAKLLGNRFFFWGFAAGAIIGAAVGTAVTRSYSFNPVDPSSEVGVTDAFHRVYHNNWWNRTVLNTYWLGVQTMQCPLDMWVMQEIMYETRPDVVIETGTRLGGSALYFASIFDLLGRGRVISIDIRDYPGKPKHNRVTYLVGSSVSEGILKAVASLIEPGERVLVFLDSDHAMAHVLREMELYARFIGQGQYLIVSDTHLNGHPIFMEPLHRGPGPMEALDIFLKNNPAFASDRNREKYGLTFNPRGFLKRER